MYKVGITGGIGSGKSTVCRMFAELGVAVYDSDAEARGLMTGSVELRETVCREFGDDIYKEDGSLDRARLAAAVFADDDARRRLNAIVHPAVISDFEAWAQRQSGDYVLLESAILFEAGLEGHVDLTIAVMACQADDDFLREHADMCMINIDLDELREEVAQCDKKLRYRAARYGDRS